MSAGLLPDNLVTRPVHLTPLDFDKERNHKIENVGARGGHVGANPIILPFDCFASHLRGGGELTRRLPLITTPDARGFRHKDGTFSTEICRDTF